MAKMHQIVWGLVGVFTLFVVSYPVAMYRVSQMEKFQGFHVQSDVLEAVGSPPQP